jgi:hypothetical protein
MISVIANYEEKPKEEPELNKFADIINNNNYSHRELPKPSLNIDELIEKSKAKRKTARPAV